MVTPPHTTPPQMAFPFTGRSHLMEWRSHLMEWRSHLLGVPSYWALPWLGGGARLWPSGAGGEESGAGSGPPRSRSGPGPGPRHFLRPKRHLAMAWRRRRQAMGTPSNWELPVNFRKRHLRCGGVGWGGVGLDGVEARTPPTRMIILIILGLSEA